MDRVVVCPYCQKSSPQPLQVGLAHQCGCGAAFAILPEDEFGIGVVRLVSGLFQETSSPLTEMLEHCQVTVYRNYEASQDSVVPAGVSEFVREIRFNDSSESAINLVWVAKNINE